MWVLTLALLLPNLTMERLEEPAPSGGGNRLPFTVKGPAWESNAVLREQMECISGLQLEMVWVFRPWSFIGETATAVGDNAPCLSFLRDEAWPLVLAETGGWEPVDINDSLLVGTWEVTEAMRDGIDVTSEYQTAKWVIKDNKVRYLNRHDFEEATIQRSTGCGRLGWRTGSEYEGGIRIGRGWSSTYVGKAAVLIPDDHRLTLWFCEEYERWPLVFNEDPPREPLRYFIRTRLRLRRVAQPASRANPASD